MYTWTPKRLYFFGHFAYDHIFWSYGIYTKISNSKLHACGGNHDTSIFQICFQYFVNIFQYCPILQLFNMFSIFINILQTCHLSPNTAKYGHMAKKKHVISPNSAVFGQITGKKWSYGVPGMYMYIYIYIWLCIYIYVYIYIYIRRPLPSLGLGGAAPGITVGVQHGSCRLYHCHGILYAFRNSKTLHTGTTCHRTTLRLLCHRTSPSEVQTVSCGKPQHRTTLRLLCHRTSP